MRLISINSIGLFLCCGSCYNLIFAFNISVGTVGGRLWASYCIVNALIADLFIVDICIRFSPWILETSLLLAGPRTMLDLRAAKK